MSELKLEKRGHAAIITLNNPPANTWTPKILNQLLDLITSLGNDSEIYTLILASENKKFFSAGADLNQFDQHDPGQAFKFINAFGSAFEALTNFPGVSIAAINGYAVGGGLEVALCCDVRIVGPDAYLALPEAGVGLLPGGLGSQQLPWLIGEPWAKQMILLGESVCAELAVTIGLAHEVVSNCSLLDRALEIATKVEKQSPTSVRYCKQLIMAARNQPLSSIYAKERELFVKLWDTQDRKEGVSAFLEKRKPKWTNN